MDYLIRNTTIIDGSGAAPRRGDLAIRSGRLVSAEEAAPGARVIDAGGLTAVPGFIDMHSHGDLQNLRGPDMKIRQGITTEVLGQDGLGVAPVSVQHLALLQDLAGGLQGQAPPGSWTWRGFGEYLDALDARGLPANAAVLVSHGPARLIAAGMAARPLTGRELALMRHTIDEAMREGAFGFSTGLIYPPCSYSDTEELTEICKVVALRGGLFVVHQRDEAGRLAESFAELEQITRASGVRLHISHLQAFGPPSWPAMDGVIAAAEKLAADGYQVSWDRYPYLAGCTVLSAVLPGWAHEDGPAALIENLKRPGYRQRLRAEFAKGLDVWSNRAILLGWSKVVISDVGTEKNRWMQGQTIASLAEQLQQDPVELICDLLVEENLNVRMISHYGSQEVLEKVLCHPMATLGTDGIAGGRPHPRLYGALPRFFQMFVRERGLLSLEEAVHKATGRAAAALGLTDRGLLRDGWWADLVLLDAEGLEDCASYEKPEVYPGGIEYVFVNGQAAVEQGAPTGRLAGRALRKTRKEALL